MCLLLLNMDLSCPSSVALGRAIQLIDVLRDASPYAKMEQVIALWCVMLQIGPIKDYWKLK
ncbi:hypothetical protein ACHAW6_010489 [Cyclotella cf. meneghiniana]